MNGKLKSLPHDQLSTIMVVGGFKVKSGEELRTCACCGAGIRNVVVVQKGRK